MTADYTLPPDTRSVGSGDPPADMNSVVDALTAMGATLNVLNAAYAGGADPTGTTDSTAAIQAALNAATPGQAVFLPAGTYQTTAPLIIPEGITLQGPQANQQAALGSTSDWGAVFVPAAGFSGSGFNATAVLLAQEVSTSVGSNRMHVRNLMIDGSAGPASVDGFAAYGSVGGFSVENVLVQYATGNGFACYADGSGNAADGLYFTNCLAQAATGNGFTLTATDASMFNCHGQSCGGDAIQLTGSNARLFGCRGDLSTNGITIKLPASPAGGNYSSGFSDSVTLTGCGTQLNAQNGLNILDSFGSGTPAATMVIVNGCSFDMDGVNGGSGGGGYAGISVNGVAVVTISNTRVMTDTHGVTGGSPEYAIATSASGTGSRVPISVRVGGASWLSGVTAIYNDAAPASSWSVTSDTLTYTGAHSSHITASNVLTTPMLGCTAQDARYAGWAYDPVTAGGTSRLMGTFGTLFLIGFPVRTPGTVGNVAFVLETLGSSLTTAENLIGLYSGNTLTGTLLGYSADQTAAWNTGGSTGAKAIALTAQSAGSLYLQPSWYYAAFLVNGTGSAGTTSIAIQSGSNISSAGWANGRMTAFTSFRWGTNGSSLTGLPTSIDLSSSTLTQVTYWVAVY